MRIAVVLTPLNQRNLKLAAQVGVQQIVGRYPGTDYDALARLRDQIADYGMRLSIIEGGLPIEKIKLGVDGRDEQIREMQTLIRNMGKAGVPILCDNFMPAGDWARTSWRIPDRGGALVSGFDADQVKAQSASDAATEAVMWENLKNFLKQVVLVAEDAGVKLSMHPDDPPISRFRGHRRIMCNLAAIERLVSLVPSPSNGICFCQGTFASMGVDVLDAIGRLGRHINYVHFRDVRGTVPKFTETFHDNGPTNMLAAMQAYKKVGFEGPMRPDHVPQLVGEEGGEPGYTMLGRLFAVGYMRGLIQAVSGGDK